MSRRSVVVVIVCCATAVLFLAAQSTPTNSTPKPSSTFANLECQNQDVKLNTEPSSANWPNWGGAVNSAQNDGAGFFDRDRAQKFESELRTNERKYVVALNSRRFLPLPAAEIADSLNEVDSAGKSVTYLQFFEHPTEAQRAELISNGVELLSFVSGYAWLARGTPEAFRAALKNDNVRAIAKVDPRDKMSAQVFLQNVPLYASAENGQARYSLLTLAGTDAAQIEAELAESGLKDDVAISPARKSILGPRFGIVASPDSTRRIAGLKSAAFLSYATPPVASRDSVTDDQCNVTDVRDYAPNLSGSGVKVAVREIGTPYPHVDFASRMNLVDNDGSTFSSDAGHATAVVGQIASNGTNNPAAKGIAPAANVLVYSLTNDPFSTPDIMDALSRGVRISSHSYGPTGLNSFGEYDPISADWDGALRAGNLIGFFAGNEEVGGQSQHIDFFVGAKNTLCVSATNGMAHAIDDSPPTPKSDGIASFVEYGPMQDGRVKPDLVALGDRVVETAGTNNMQARSGTSFSTPAAAGMSALIMQHYRNVIGADPSNALLKALMCNSATDLGNPGPDAVYGFGIINVEEAVNTINGRQSPLLTPFIDDTISNGVTKTYSFTVQSLPQLKATLCWFDVPGNPSAAKALVNDLDLKITAPDGTTVYYPFSLNPQSPLANATATGPNSVDPIEQIVIDNPADGTWTLTVSASIPQGNQSFAVVLNRGLFQNSVAAMMDASPVIGPAPLNVSFSAAQSAGNISYYSWDFGDGTSAADATLVDTSHTYSSPGTYTVTLTLNNSTSITGVIRVTKAQQMALASKGKALLKFKDPPSAPDDSLQFTISSPDLVKSSTVARTMLPQLEGKVFQIRAGGNPDGSVAGLKLGNALLDKRGGARTDTLNFKLNLTKGNMKVMIKKQALEVLFGAAGMTRDPSSTGIHPLPVEVETADVIYSGVLNFYYKNTNGSSGSAKSP